MPLIPDDVLVIAKKVLIHWPQVNAALPKPLTLQIGLGVTELLVFPGDGILMYEPTQSQRS